MSRHNCCIRHKNAFSHLLLLLLLSRHIAKMKCSSYQFVCVVIHVVTSSHFICLISATCAMPGPIPNSITTLSNQTLDTGSYFTWECSDGYMMDGLTNTVVWVCLEDGSWLGHTPICTAIECPSPPIAAYSELDPLSPEAPVVNQTISYNCSSSKYTLIGSNLNRCLQDGTWENDPPVCQRDCDDRAYYVKRYSDLTCYRIRGGYNERNWMDSLDLCNADGELLATVKDAETQTFLVDFIDDEIEESVWIGAMEGRDWMWRHSGEYIERFFWQNPFPSANLQDCIELSYQDGSFSWSPRSNQGNNGLLCQYETRMNYENWNRREPSSNSEECLEMRWDFRCRWNDLSCSDRNQALCQIGIPACGDPGEPLHGNRLPDDRTTYSVDATLHFICQEGYTLSRESVLRCMNNGAWNHQRPSCEAVGCGNFLPEVALASTMKLGSVYQDIAVYTCQYGYIPDNEPISFCQRSGTWSTPNFTCTALSQCYSNPCMNGGTCYEVDGSPFACKCTPNYTGATCDEVPTPTSSPTVSSLPNSTSAGGFPSSIATVIGSVVGAILVIVIVIVLIIFYKRRSNESATTKSKGKEPDSSSQYENPVFDQSQTDAHTYQDLNTITHTYQDCNTDVQSYDDTVDLHIYQEPDQEANYEELNDAKEKNYVNGTMIKQNKVILG